MNEDTPQTSFKELWSQACDEYQKLVGFGLDHPDIPRVNNVDELLDVIGKDNEDFDKARYGSSGKAFSRVLRVVVGPFELFSNLLGGTASAVFPPSQQILGALTVLVNTGKAVTGSFDAIAGLFSDLQEFGTRLGPLTSSGIPNELATILTGIIVHMLKIMALATDRSMKLTGQDVRHPRLHKMLQKTRRFRMLTAEYTRQLLSGEDSRIEGAKADLNRLIQEEEKMTIALLYQNGNFTKSLVIEIKGMSVEIKDSIEKVQLKLEESLVVQKTTQQGVDQLQVSVQRSSGLLEDNSRSLNTISDRLNSIQSLLRGNKLLDEQMTTAMRQKVAKQLLKPWLSTFLNPSEDNIRLLETTTWMPHTTDWLLNSCEPMTEWLEHRLAAICITGETGTGKTVLTRRIIEHMGSLAKSSGDDQPQTIFAYHFCRAGRTNSNVINDALRSLAFQLAETDPDYKAYLVKASNEKRLVRRDTVLIGSPEGSTQTQNHNGEQDGCQPDSPISRLWQVLFHEYLVGSDMTGKRLTIRLLIDSIEEGAEVERDEILEAIKRTVEMLSANVKLQLLVTIRPTLRMAVSASFSSQEIAFIEPDKHNKPDIERFVDHQLDKSWSNRLVTQSLFATTAKSIVKNAAGNFLWARLVIEEVTSHAREDIILATLRKLPADLMEAITLIMRRFDKQLDESEKEDMEDIIAWVHMSGLDLTLADLDSILAAREGNSARVLDLQARMRHTFSSIFELSPFEYVYSIKEDSERSRKDANRGRDLEALGLSTNPGESLPLIDDGSTMPEDPGPAVYPSKRSRDVELEDMTDAMENFRVTIGNSFPVEMIQAKYESLGKRTLTAVDMKEKILAGYLDLLQIQGRIEEDTPLHQAGLYAASKLCDAIADADVSNASNRGKIRIACGLTRLFQDETLLYNWIERAGYGDVSVARTVLTSSFCDQTLAWLQEVTRSPELFTPEHHTWVSEITRQPFKKLFEHLAKVGAHTWLQTRIAWCGEYFQVVHQYLILIEYNLPDPPSDVSKLSFGECSLERIKAIASWAGFEEDSLWYERVGFALCKGGQTDDSIDAYRRSIELDGDNVWARIGLMEVFSTMGNYEAAILVIESALPLLRAETARLLVPTSKSELSPRSRYFDSFLDMADAYAKLGRNEEAVNTCLLPLLAWDVVKRPEQLWFLMEIAIRCLGLMIDIDDFDAAIALLKKILEAQEIKVMWLCCDDFLINGHICRALQKLTHKTKELDLLDRTYATVWTAIRKYGMINRIASFRLTWAQNLSRLYPDRRDKSISVYQSLVGMNIPGDTFQVWRMLARYELAKTYIDMILQSREVDEWTSVGQLAQELVHIAGRADDGTKQSNIWDNNFASLILAAWYRECGKRDRAKECAAACLNNGIEWLYDNDPDNDGLAWGQISNAMLVAGDRRRAIDAYGMARQIAFYGVDREDEPASKASREVTNPLAKEARRADEPSSTSAPTEPPPTISSSDGLPQSTARIDAQQLAVVKAASEATNPTESIETPSSLTPSPSSAPGASSTQCDGPCFLPIPVQAPLWRCSHCLADLCGACHFAIEGRKVKNAKSRGEKDEQDEVGWNICGELHERVQISNGVEGKMYPRGYIRVRKGDGAEGNAGEGDFVEVEDWIAEVRGEWGI